jgi:hypothetical protein
MESNKQTAASMRKVTRILAAFRDVDPGMTVIQALAFCYGSDPEIDSQREVERRLGVSNAASSRAATYWCQVTYPGRSSPGPLMLTQKEHPDDRRYRTLSPNPKGIAFLHRLVDIMEH